MAEREKPSSDCFAHEKLLLKVFGLQNCRNIFYRIYGILLLMILTIYQILAIIGLSKTNKTFDDLVVNLLYAIGPLVADITAMYFYWNRGKIEKLFEKLDSLNTLSNCDNGIDGNSFMLKYKILIGKQGYFGSVAVLSATSAVTLLSFVLSLNKEEWILPFGSGINVKNDNIKYISNVITANIAAFLATTEFVMYANMLTFISGHCKLFQKYIIAIMDCQDTNSSPDVQNQNQESKTNFKILNNGRNVIDWKMVKTKLRKLIPYHVGIYEAGAEVENVFNTVVLFWFGGLSGCSCLLLYNITTVSLLSVPGVRDLCALLWINTTLSLISSCGEQVITESEKIGSICYDVDFVGADRRIRNSLILVMIRAQKPIVLTIGKFKILNLNTMLGILQLTYSYYTILGTLSTK